MSGDYPVDTSGLSNDDIRRVARRTEQWARAAQHAGQPTEAASLFSIAGSYYAHVRDVGPSANALRAAAQLHMELQNPYAFALATAAADVPMASAAINVESADAEGRTSVPVSADALAQRATALAFLHASERDHELGEVAAGVWGNLAEAVGSRAATPTGRLHIPLGLTTDVVRATVAVTNGGAEAMPRLTRTLRDYLHRADAITAEASADEYHWRTLMSSVLPVEPEVLALTVAAITAAERYTDVGWQLIEGVDLSPAAQEVVIVARAMLRPKEA